MMGIERAWAQSLMRFVHLGEQARTKSGKLFTVARIEEGPEPKVYIFSGPHDDVIAGEAHATGWELAG
jgi:hypothetical protein